MISSPITVTAASCARLGFPLPSSCPTLVLAAPAHQTPIHMRSWRQTLLLLCWVSLPSLFSATSLCVQSCKLLYKSPQAFVNGRIVGLCQGGEQPLPDNSIVDAR